jgi:hypothetical protein
VPNQEPGLPSGLSSLNLAVTDMPDRHEVFTLALDNKLYLAPLPKTLNVSVPEALTLFVGLGS